MAVEVYKNPHRGSGLPDAENLAAGEVATDATAAIALYQQCPHKMTTSLQESEHLARRSGVAKVYLKREDERMRYKLTKKAYIINIKKTTLRGRAALAITKTLETLICDTHALKIKVGSVDRSGTYNISDLSVEHAEWPLKDPFNRTHIQICLVCADFNVMCELNFLKYRR